MKKKLLAAFLISTSISLAGYNSYATNANAAENSENGDNLSLEQLMDTKIYSASKRPEKISDTASSVYVVTAEDIKRSGVTSIPEALRMVPGVNVAQTNANTWAISIRGFNRQFSNKLLVLIDGRSVYTPLFSGVYWDSQDYVLEDIDRIEVIKGPGGTLWGANAVNGVINIITKEARKTKGNYASTTIGTNGQGTVEFRNGSKTGEYDYLRVYGKVRNFEEQPSVTRKADNNDNWNTGQTGFRYDFRDWNIDKLTLQGDFYQGRKAYPLTLPGTGNVLSHEDFSGGNVMLKWNKPTQDYNTDIQAYVDYASRKGLPVFESEIVTYDLDVQTQRDIGRNSLIGGIETRYITDNLTNSQYLSYRPSDSSVSILSTFLQDKIGLVPDKLFLILGSKFDYNDYTNFEIQPNARLLYQINPSNSVWAAVSRAVRTPSRGEDSFGRLAVTSVVGVTGNHSFESEKLTAYEIGYRSDITNNTFFDISAFFNNYDDLRTTEQLSGPTFTSRNNGYGETYGIESYIISSVTDKVDLKLGHTLLEQSFHENTSDTSLQRDEERSPENQFTAGSYVKLRDDINWDTNLYYVSNLHYFTLAGTRTRIDSYSRLDTQVRWEAAKNLEFSIIGQNLTDDKHQEFDEVIYSTPSYMSRALLGRVSFKW